MRQLAVVAFPPASEMRDIEAIRRQFDPLADAMPAHITLVFPFHSRVSDIELNRRVRQAAEPITAFNVTLGPVFVHDESYLFSNIIDGAETVVSLHRRLYERLGDAGATLIKPYVPHVTVGRLSRREEADAAAAELARTFAGGAATVTAVSLYVIDNDRRHALEPAIPLPTP